MPGVYSEPNGTLLCLLLGHSGGITHLQFSPDGTKLLSGGRKDSEIICWDMRNPGTVLFSVQRNVTTNQRMYFDITPDSRHLVSGKWIYTIVKAGKNRLYQTGMRVNHLVVTEITRLREQASLQFFFFIASIFVIYTDNNTNSLICR